MHKSISYIITEEIDNAVMFAQLEDASKSLKNLYPNVLELKRNQGDAKEIHQFFVALQQFTLSLIHALDRCCRDRNINEAFGVNMYSGNYGLQNVPALSNLWNAMKQGWRDAGAIFGNNPYGWRRRGKGEQEANRGEEETAPDYKLKELIYQHYISLCNEYDKVNKKYDGYLDKLNPPIPKYVSQQVQVIKAAIEKAQ